MTDPIAVLVRTAEAAASEAELVPDPVAAVRVRVDRRRTARRVRIAAVAAAAVVLVSGAVVLATGGGGEPEDVATTPDPTTTDPSPPTTLDPADVGIPRTPLSPRRSPAVTSITDPDGTTIVVVWGGVDAAGRPLDDGAAYDTATRTWRELAPSPLAGRPDEGLPPVAVDIGAGIVVGRGRAAARWDETDGTWTRLDDAPGVLTDLVAIAGSAASVSANAVLDGESSSWLPVADPPVALQQPVAVRAGSEIIAVGDADDRVGALALDPLARTWRQLEPPPGGWIGDRALAASWDGERVVVTDHEMRATAYDPAADTWEDLPAVPARVAEHTPSMASAGGVSVVITARTVGVLDALRRTWTPFPSPAPSLGGTGPYALVPVDDTTVALWIDHAGPDGPDLVVFDPTTLAGRDRRRQVGAASVVMAGDEYVLGSLATEDGALAVDLLTAAGEHCRVTSGLGLPLGSDEQRAVREELPVEDPDGPGARLVWFHDEAGTRWEAEVDDADLLVIDCGDAGAARRLVGSVALT